MAELGRGVSEVADAEVYPHLPVLTHPHIYLSPRLVQLNEDGSCAVGKRGGQSNLMDVHVHVGSEC